MVTDGRSDLLDTGGIILGMLNDASFELGTLALRPGDVILLYTDGVSEAMNHAEEELGEPALHDALRASAASPPTDILGDLLRLIGNHQAAEHAADDQTFIVVKVPESQP